MGKMLQRALTACVISSLVVLMLSNKVIVQAMVLKTTEHVDTVTVDVKDKDRVCYFYVPTSTTVGTRSCNSPVMIVFGDKVYNADTAKTEAQNSGLADIAAKEGSIIVFANPYGTEWSAADDVDLYASIMACFSDSSSINWVDGKGTKNGKTFYCGAAERAYLFGDGDGADFVAENYLATVTKTTVYPTGAVVSDITPTSYLLSNLTKTPTTIYEKKEFPTVVINGPVGIENIIKALNPVNHKYLVSTSANTTGFDKERVIEAYTKVTGTVRRQNNVIKIVPDYMSLGIIETLEADAIKAGTIEYFQYIPDDLDMAKAGTVPLVMLFHGGGSTAEYYAWASEWPLIAKQDGLMIVSVQNHNSYTSDDIVELLKKIETKYPAIDTSRIYACGFSMGSVKSWNLGIKHSNVFAGIIPCASGYMTEPVGTDQYVKVELPSNTSIMPTFYVGGGISPLNELPSKKGTKNNVDGVLEAIFTINQVTDSYAFDAAADSTWGIAPDTSFTLENPDYPDSPLKINEYISADGNVYTALCLETNKAHAVYSADTYAAWKFISQFSRNADGTISIATASNEEQGPAPEAAKDNAVSPKTGDTTNAAAFAFLLLAGTAIVVITKKKFNSL